MAKHNYRRQSDNTKNIPEVVDEFENYGYDIQNAKRYASRSKRQAKFKDYDDYDD